MKDLFRVIQNQCKDVLHLHYGIFDDIWLLSKIHSAINIRSLMFLVSTCVPRKTARQKLTAEGIKICEINNKT